MSDILDRSLLASSPKVAGGKLATKPSSDKIFEALMASADAKKKALRDARTLRTVVPPIGMAAMMRIASKFIK